METNLPLQDPGQLAIPDEADESALPTSESSPQPANIETSWLRKMADAACKQVFNMSFAATKKKLRSCLKAKIVGLWLGGLGCSIAFLFGMQQWISGMQDQSWSQKAAIWAHCMSNEVIRTTIQCEKAFEEAWGGVPMWQMERFVWQIALPWFPHLLIGEPDSEGTATFQLEEFDFSMPPYRTSLIPVSNRADKFVIRRDIFTTQFPGGGGHSHMRVRFNMSAIRPVRSRGYWDDSTSMDFPPHEYQMSNVTSKLLVPSARWEEFYAFVKLFSTCTHQILLHQSYPDAKNVSDCLGTIWTELYDFRKMAMYANFTRAGNEVDVEKTRPWSQLCRWKLNGDLQCVEDIGNVIFQRWNE